MTPMPTASLTGVVLILLASGANAAQPSPSGPSTLSPQSTAAPQAPGHPPFKLFRYEEDYAYLADPARRTGLLDPLKYIPLSQEPDFTLSLGGEIRYRYEYTDKPAFGLRSRDHDDYLLQRLLFHTDFRFGEQSSLNLRAFVQFASGFVFGEDLPKPANQDNELDLQQGFLDINLGDARPIAKPLTTSSTTLRIGRQEVGLGSYRLVTSREPTNSRLNFDGLRVTHRNGAFTLEGVLLRPVQLRPDAFDDNQDDSTSLWGLYAILPLDDARSINLDLYYLGFQRDQARFAQGLGDELRHSIGTRLWGRAQGWDHDTEAIFQFGDFSPSATARSSQDILAWTIASNTGYTFKSAGTPRVGLKLNYASGDQDPGDGRLGTFNPLFPRNNYFSDANLLAPFNFFNIHPTVSFRPDDSLVLTAGSDSFFRASTDDAVFAPSGITIPAAASSEHYVGTTFSLTAEYTINRYLALTLSYAHFLPGDVVDDAGGDPVNFLGVWLTAKF